MNRNQTSAPGIRPDRTGGGSLRLPWLLVLLTAACGVTRAPIDERSDPAALPNLRRASQALQERIVREKQHVIGLNQQLSDLLASEARVYAEVFAAEATYQRLRTDADDVQADVAAINEELAGLRRQLESRRVEREATLAELQALEAELAVGRREGLDARREIDFWRGGVDASGEVSAFRQLRLEEFRKRWEIPVDKWVALMEDLGLSRILIDLPDPPSVKAPEPLPPDSLPPPEGVPASSDEVSDDGGGDGDSDSP